MQLWLIILIVFISGYLFRFIIELFDLGMQHLNNKESLSVSKMNAEIEKLNDKEEPELPMQIGFNTYPEDEEYITAEDNKVKE